MRQRTDRILFGGDCNPEQWPEEIWEEDMRLFHRAHICELTRNVFSWGLLQPSEEQYDFSQLDRIMDLCRREGISVILATSTAAQPAWMSARYPETNRTDAHENRHRFGGRQNICPTSRVFRKYASALAGKLSERYAGYDNLLAWHISNEYGGYCYCGHCQEAYRSWLKERYGSIGALNRAWNTAFWGHRFQDFSEARIPDYLTEEFDCGEERALRTNVQGNAIDYRRFMTDCTIDLIEMEEAAIRKHSDLPVTTNLMYNFDGFELAKIARHLDVVSWDNCPAYGDDNPFSLMEQTPRVTNWHPYCRLKRPGIMRLLSYQAVAHGADTVLFFQMRRSRGACGKYHGALIDHVGTGNTRVFRGMTALGGELERLGDALLGARSDARAAILFDWDSWWGTELSAGPSVLISCLREIQTWYRAFWQLHIPVDLLPLDAVLGNPDREQTAIRDPEKKNPEGAAALGAYDLVIAPMLYLDKNGFSEALHAYAAGGGRFVTSYFSGYADDTDLVRLGGYPANWKDVLGLWVEESDALPHPLRSAASPGRIDEGPCRLCGGLPSGNAGGDMASLRRGIGLLCGDRLRRALLPEVSWRCLRGCRDFAPCQGAAGCRGDTEKKGRRVVPVFPEPCRREKRNCLPVGGMDLLTGNTYQRGEVLQLEPADVVILRETKESKENGGR